MKPVWHRASRLSIPVLLVLLLLSTVRMLAAQPLPLKRAVELALSHSTTAGAALADEQRAIASYREAHNQYIPQFILGSGLGASWGYPLSLEGSAPSIVNLNAQSALINPALRDFVRAAKTEWKASTMQTKDQRNQVIQDTVLSYVELGKWEVLTGHLQQEQSDAARMEQIVSERVQEGVDNPLAQNKARLTSARVRMRIAEARGAIDVLRNRLSQLTGLPASAIETVPESIPAMPEVKQEDDLVAKAVESSPAVQAAANRATAQSFRARGEHRAMWPTIDFAAQYALLARYNNYGDFFQHCSGQPVTCVSTFQPHNATVGVAIRFPFLSRSQHAHAEAADAQALRATKDAETAKHRVSEETLKLQRAVEQLAAAQEVADLEFQVAQSNLEALRVRMDAGTAALHDVEDARTQANERYNALRDASFELQRARISLLRATGELGAWVGVGN
jgi:outer membrane protein